MNKIDIGICNEIIEKERYEHMKVIIFMSIAIITYAIYADLNLSFNAKMILIGFILLINNALISIKNYNVIEDISILAAYLISLIYLADVVNGMMINFADQQKEIICKIEEVDIDGYDGEKENGEKDNEEDDGEKENGEKDNEDDGEKDNKKDEDEDNSDDDKDKDNSDDDGEDEDKETDEYGYDADISDESKKKENKSNNSSNNKSNNIPNNEIDDLIEDDFLTIK